MMDPVRTRVIMSRCNEKDTPVTLLAHMATSPKRGHTETSLDAALLREVLKKQEQASEGAWEAASYVLTDTRGTRELARPGFSLASGRNERAR